MPKYLCCGFTLLELMISLSLLIILMGTTSYSLRVFCVREQVQQLQQNLYDLILYARAEALVRGQNLKLCDSSDGRTCKSVAQNEWPDGLLLSAVEQILHFEQKKPSSIHLYWVSGLAWNEALNFKADGSIGVQQGSFYLCPERPYHFLARALVVLRSGRLRVEDDYTKLAAHC